MVVMGAWEHDRNGEICSRVIREKICDRKRKMEDNDC